MFIPTEVKIGSGPLTRTNVMFLSVNPSRTQDQWDSMRQLRTGELDQYRE